MFEVPVPSKNYLQTTSKMVLFLKPLDTHFIFALYKIAELEEVK